MPRLGHGSGIKLDDFLKARAEVAARTADIPLGFAVAKPVDLNDFDFMFPKLQHHVACAFDGNRGSRLAYPAMVLSSRAAPRRRILLALLALAANLVAAGVPLLHAAAHLGHHQDAPHTEALLAAVDHAEHDHGEAHPAALHDAAPSVRTSLAFALVTPEEAPLPALPVRESREISILAPRPASRAPPPGDPARAPPLA
jgi:hypothetical protein